MKMLNILFKGKFTFINDSKETEIKNVAFQKNTFCFFCLTVDSLHCSYLELCISLKNWGCTPENFMVWGIIERGQK